MRTLAAGSFTVFLFTAVAPGGTHPALLMSARDLPRLRHVCGVEATPTASNGSCGVRAADFNALRQHFVERPEGDALPGELAAAAFLLCVAPHEPGADQRLALLEAGWLGDGAGYHDPFEQILALDWAWPALPGELRERVLAARRERAALLTPADSPLDPALFRTKLAALAHALVIDERDDPSQTWRILRIEILDAAREYFKTTFPAFLAARGRVPTCPADAAREQADIVIALELAGLLARGDPRDAFGEHARLLEHYVMAHSIHPALQHHFIRDEAGDAAALPVGGWDECAPLTAHLLAARTSDPAAAWVAQRIEGLWSGGRSPPASTAWRFTPLIFDMSRVPVADVARLPRARNLEGALTFRGGQGLDACIVWVEAAQPILRDGQHFDAGHFMIRRAGELVVAGGDNVGAAATPQFGGRQRLSDRGAPFDFRQYACATIAHNGLILWNPHRAAQWNGQPFEPIGGQRAVEGRAAEFSTPSEATPRHRGHLIAYGADDTAVYAALDLAAAYDPRDVAGYTREFLFFWEGALLVIDRVTCTHSSNAPVVTLQVPSRPTLAGADLDTRPRVYGRADAGVWDADDAPWITWTERRGRIWFAAVAPEPIEQRICGGPAQRLIVDEGRNAGRGYMGGAADGFERLILPVSSGRLLNAWYRLGQPPLLPASVGKLPHWGRIELRAKKPARSHAFITVLIATDANDALAPQIAAEGDAERFTLRLDHAGRRAELSLGPRAAAGGVLRLCRAGDDDAGRAWPLPTAVTPDAPLPILPP